MLVIHSLNEIATPTRLALGNFDGIHLGHQAVIQSLTPMTETLSAPQTESLKAVVSFSPHPQDFFTGQSRPLLTPRAEKIALLEKMGVDCLILLPFDQALAQLTPTAFIEQVLFAKFKAEHVSVGFNFCFGHQRSGTAQDLQAIATQAGVSVTIIPPQIVQGEPVSSSAIREALTVGDVRRCRRLLGRDYQITGTVIAGQQLGRTIGFPTANLKLPPLKFLPRQGVYAVTVHTANQQHLGVMNIGQRPTVNGQTCSTEVHLLDWSGDLYGHTVTVNLQHFLRPEQKFDTLEDLTAQISRDCEIARSEMALLSLP